MKTKSSEPKALKKLLSICLMLLLASTTAFAAYTGNPGLMGKSEILSATDVAAEYTVSRRHLVIVNRGTDEVYFTVNSSAAATTSNIYLNSGESIALDASENSKIHNLRYVCAAAETASVMVIAFD